MYQGFRIASVHGRVGKDLLHIDFRDAEEGMALVLHPERPDALQIELRLLGQPFEVVEEQAPQHFTEQQFRRYHALEIADAEEAARETTAQPLNRVVPKNVRTWWPSTRLTFIKRQIESLAPDEMFAVEVLNQATYAMSRRQFELEFANVVRSISYAVYGSYNYSVTPHKAAQFIVK